MQAREHQIKAVESCFIHLEQKKTHPIISATGGAGKSFMISMIVEILSGQGHRCLVLADRKRLLTQNRRHLHPDCNVGIVSAGLDLWQFDKQIVIGGIQTVYNKAEQLGARDYIIIDECDLWSGDADSMYGQLVNKYPEARIIGLTGTPFRTGEGRLTWGEVCYSITYKDLLEKKYLSPITNKIVFKPDLSKVPKLGGDYTEKGLKEQFLDKANIGEWVEKLAPYKDTRKKWLVFLPSVEYANQFAFALSTIKVLARAVTSETKNIEKIYEEFEFGDIQCLVSVGIIERGTDFPFVDLLVDIAPTKSLKRWLQRIWRLVRICEGKKDGWYLDFAGNLREHGSINNQDFVLENGEIKIKKKYVEKICPACETYVPAFAKVCPHCNHEFLTEKIQKKAFLEADTESDINAEWKPKDELKWYYVKQVYYDPEYVAKRTGYKMLKVTYQISDRFNIYEYVKTKDRLKWLAIRGWKGGKVNWLELKKPKLVSVKTGNLFLERCKWE